MVFKFTIDRLVNPFIPSSQKHRLSPPFRRFIGGHTPSPKHDYLIWIDILVSSFCGLAVIEAVFKSHTVFSDHHAPLIIASYGASAILCFNALSAPLAQPRSVFMGHFIALVIGVGIQKLFALSEAGRNNYWASGALSVGVALVLMSIFNCVHPPAGASALLPLADEAVRQMGWWYLPVQLVSLVLIIAVACITGNLIRSYPVYWWLPIETGQFYRKSEKKQPDESEPEPETPPDVFEGITYVKDLTAITISNADVLVPEQLVLDEVDIDWLDGMRERLRRLNGLEV